MIQTLQARDLTLKLLGDRIGVQRSRDEDFFLLRMTASFTRARLTS
jgi:hypothetical protein